jgi:hypothetical protein
LIYFILRYSCIIFKLFKVISFLGVVYAV